jgi:hypothetical protein
VPLTNEIDVVAQMEKILTELSHNRGRLEQLRRQGMAYVQERLTWDAKAQTVTRVLNWALRRGPKPDLPPPKDAATAANRRYNGESAGREYLAKARAG